MSITYGEQRTAEEKLYDAQVMERVQRGIAFLQREHGPGWEDKIDLTKLNLKLGDACVLGQVYAEEARTATKESGGYYCGYSWASERFFSDDEVEVNLADIEVNTIAHGFCIDDDNWAPLQQAWEDALTPLVMRGDDL